MRLNGDSDLAGGRVARDDRVRHARHFEHRHAADPRLQFVPFAAMATDFEAEGLLDGLDGEAREARRRLLEELEASGVPLAELRAAVAEGRLALMPLERVLAPRRRAPHVRPDGRARRARPGLPRPT